MVEAIEELKISECMNSHDEENPIKSVATIKHQIRAPANFARLKFNTDLNVPPTNWLSSSFNSYGLQQALSQATGFSSFRMAHLFPDCLGEVDVVSNAENIKRLLKLPYASNCTISMMVHRVGSTLLIDDFDIQRFLLQQEDCNWKWLKTFICEHFITRMNEQERNIQTRSSDTTMHQRSLLSKFLYHSLCTSTTTITDSKDTLNIDYGPSNYLQDGPLLPEPNVEDVPDPKHNKHTYNRNVIWQLNENTKMLIGTDLAIFGGPGISLRLREMDKPINVLTGIDYWLDNLMCNVPEIGMCYHLNGLVQKYEIIKTEDLPFLENSQFSPGIIRNIAQSILSFLKQNATKSGHTYWLFKGHKDDVVKLYDLTSEFETSNEFDENTKQQSTKNDDDTDENSCEKDDKNPFTIPVAMLLYKVAKNMKNSTERMDAKQAGSIKALLENCLKLLPKEQYPQIVTSSYYLLSDLYVPTGIDPISPKFNNEINESESVCDSDDSGNSVEDDQHGGDIVSENIAVQSISGATKETHSNNQKQKENNFQPPPLTGTIDERCFNALQHIINGLNCLQYFSVSEEKLNKEKEKEKIILEELNPNMAKRYQAIPLPYEKIEGSKINEINVDQKMLLKKCQTSPASPSSSSSSSAVVIGSWNTHLKLLLIEKCCLIYATLTEQEYQHGRYGRALKLITIAIKCYRLVSKQVSNFLSIGANYRTNLLARAGDCYFHFVQNFSNIDEYIHQFESLSDIDLEIEQELQKDFNQQLDIDMDIELNNPTHNLEQLFLTSISSYEIALKCAAEDKGFRYELLGRIGSVRNELGVSYMHWSQEDFEKCSNVSSSSTKNEGDDNKENVLEKPEPLYMNLARKSYECFIRGISNFEEVEDNSNLSILLCNLGRFMRFRAHLQNEKELNFKKICYENAFTSYQRALTILESKKQNSQLWDLVTWELSSGKFTLAKLMQEHFQNEMNDKIEQEIIDLFMGSLKLCDTQTRSSLRTGLIYNYLGNIYCESYKRNSNHARYNKLLNLCRLYYEKSAHTFSNIDAITEYLGVQVDRLELQSVLFEGQHTATQKSKMLHTALKIACESIEQFKKINKSDDIKILKLFELQLQTTLKHLIQISITRNSDATTLKQLYSFSLQSNINRNDFMSFSKHLLRTLETIQEKC